MNKVISPTLALGILLSSAIATAKPAGPVSAREAKPHITERLQYSSRVLDKTKPFSVELRGKKGDTVRPFVASNLRGQRIPAGPSSTALITVGNRITGTLNM